VIQALTPALQQLDRRLESDLAGMAQDAKEWFLTGTGIEHLRVRSGGDTTHSLDHNLEERLLPFFVQTKLPIRFSSEERADVDLVQSPEVLALVDPLDGSEVAARGYPMCSISVSVVHMATATPLLSRIIEVFTSIQYAASEGHATMNGTAQRSAPDSVTQ
jgi:fructose-1,6-bisphosphatase/inositol monophosphatase family enzyme